MRKDELVVVDSSARSRDYYQTEKSDDRKVFLRYLHYYFTCALTLYI